MEVEIFINVKFLEARVEFVSFIGLGCFKELAVLPENTGVGIFADGIIFTSVNSLHDDVKL